MDLEDLEPRKQKPKPKDLDTLGVDELEEYLANLAGGWASNSKYPFLGSLRSAAQMVSYEVSIGFIIITVILLVGSMNLSDIVNNQSDGFWSWHVFSFNHIVLFPVMLAML